MTTVLKAIAAGSGARFISAADLAAAVAGGHPLAFDDGALGLISSQVVPNGSVVVDDLHLVLAPAQHHFSPRYGLVSLPLLALCNKAETEDCKLVLGAACCLPQPVEERGFSFQIPKFAPRDYDWLLQRWAPETATHLEIDRIYRFAPKLNAHRLRAVVEWWRAHTPPTTQAFIDILRTLRLGSNVDLGEVQDVRLEDLVGVDDAIQTLLRAIVLPYEDEALAEELGLRAKRGVLLYGPPGTGKTTVGRALAHRLRGKFFLIDGTFIAGTDQFYQRVQHVFEAAKENSPSVIFIDDADAIFEDQGERGLYRYLLTMIDGLESESNAQVTVMLTAMNLGDLPDALVRSGRIELWLEMRLPDSHGRRTLLERECSSFPAAIGGDITPSVIDATEGLTGADLKACAADAKSLYAEGRKAGHPPKSLEVYLLEAASTIRGYREKHQQALAEARARRGQQAMLPHFGMMSHHVVNDHDD